MASPGKINGTALFVRMDSADIGFSTSCSITITQETLNTTDASTGNWNSRIPGRRDWEISCDALVAMGGAGTTGGMKFYQIFSSYMAYQQVLQLQFRTSVSGDKYFTGNAIVSELSIDAPMEETATFTVSFAAAGPLSLATLP
tara:strand:+ start:10609 stop:11037 length:429 start_codon:yes stop_codon:yes gene_type:complete